MVSVLGARENFRTSADRFDRGARVIGALFVRSPGRGRETFLPQDLSHGRRAQGAIALFQDMADFVDRIVLLSLSALRRGE